MVSGKLRNSKRCKILLTPDQARNGRNNIVLKYSVGL